MAEQAALGVQQAVASTPFVGRERELNALTGAAERARAGRGGIALLAGEPGIGKTTLAERLAERAAALGMRVLWGRCYEGSGAPAYWPWLQILRALARHTPDDELGRLLGEDAAALAQLLPEVDARLGALPALPALPPEEARFRLFESVTRVLERASRAAPLLLVLDDLHWADLSSALLLTFTLPQLHTLPLLVVGTFRDNEIVAGPLRDLLAEAGRSSASVRIALEGFTQDEVGVSIERAAGLRPSDAVITAVRDETGGNPFFVGEVARLLSAEGGLQLAAATGWRIAVPPTVRDVILRRFGRLSPACGTLLGAAAVIGRQFDVATLSTTAGEPADLLPLLDEAISARIVSTVAGEPGHFRFQHALIRETIYRELANSSRVRLHRDVAEAIERLRQYSLDDRQVVELAHHYLEAMPGGVAEKAIQFALEAARRETRLLAYDEAGEHFEAALKADETYGVLKAHERCDLLIELGEARVRAGGTEDGRRTLQAAAALAQSLNDGPRLTRAAIGFGGVVATAGSADPRLVAMIEAALTLLPPDDRARRAQLLGRLAMELQWTDEFARRDSLSGEAVTLAADSSDPVALGVALNARRYAIWSPDTLEERLTITARLVELGERTGASDFTLQALRWRIPDLLDAGDVAGADAEIDRLTRLADEVRQPLYRWYAIVYRTLRSLQSGRFAEAEPLIDETFEAGRRVQAASAVIYRTAQRTILYRELGRAGELDQELRDRFTEFPAMPIFRSLRLHALLALGRREEAAAEVRALAAAEVAVLRKDALWLMAIAELAHAAYLVDDRDAAAAIYPQLLPYAERNAMGGVPICSGAEAEYLGMLAATLRDWSAAERHYRQAIALNDARQLPPYSASSRFHLAESLLRRDEPGDRAAAATLLDKARVTAASLGMIDLLRRIEVAEAATRTQPAGATLPVGLSPRELEVLRLIALGKSNREIAEQLVISLNTVLHHVSNILGKTGAANRTEASAYAHRHELLTD